MAHTHQEGTAGSGKPCTESEKHSINFESQENTAPTWNIRLGFLLDHRRRLTRRRWARGLHDQAKLSLNDHQS